MDGLRSFKLLSGIILFFLTLIPDGGHALVMKYTYNDEGRLATARLGAGLLIEYIYDETGNIVSRNVSQVMLGDILADGSIDLRDVIAALQVSSGAIIPGVDNVADLNGDNQVGIAEAIFVMQKLGGLTND